MSAEFKTGSIDLKGQVAVVMGGGRGLGCAFAQALAAAGASVAVLARSADELAQTVALIEGAGGLARAFRADITDSKAVHRTMAEIGRMLGPVDVLVNNAGTPGLLGPFWETDVDEWWHAIDVNLRGQLLCTRAVLPEMIARRRGRIINVASGAGTIAIPYLSGYVTSKAALIRFTECLAAEIKQYGIATFAIEPGTVRTAMADFVLNSREGQKWMPWFRRIFEEGRDVTPERSAQFLLSLASGKADVLSGRFLQISDDLESILKNVQQVEKNNLYSLGIQRLGAGMSKSISGAAEQAAGKGAKK